MRFYVWVKTANLKKFGDKNFLVFFKFLKEKTMFDGPCLFLRLSFLVINLICYNEPFFSNLTRKQ